VGHLEVIVSPHPGMSANEAAHGVLDSQMPSLKRLAVYSAAGALPEFHLQSEKVPTLLASELGHLRPRILTPLTSVTDLLYSTSSVHALRHHLPDILSKLPNLQHLALEMSNLADVQGSMEHTILPSLISLEVRWVTPLHIDDVVVFFGAFSLPNLRSLVLHNEYQDEDYITLLQSLV
jgi:hypothetical protein